ncbi:hypothetical protein RJ639_046704 [Escallonia herrerae]|uniref:Uncharacterized protein n=1 Tax=Escallonia herrerae TaxID=1293975 RepID=A0AA88WAW0_9ASTE|nr:hypothetical protein RJ639_046704 [Escallonia herrerae]
MHGVLCVGKYKTLDKDANFCAIALCTSLHDTTSTFQSRPTSSPTHSFPENPHPSPCIQAPLRHPPGALHLHERTPPNPPSHRQKMAFTMNTSSRPSSSACFANSAACPKRLSFLTPLTIKSTLCITLCSKGTLTTRV